VNLFTSL